MRISDSQAFKVCDIVETDFNGKPSRHIVAARYRVPNSESGICYMLIPPVHPPHEGGHPTRIDHAWLKKVGHISFGDFGMIDFGDAK